MAMRPRGGRTIPSRPPRLIVGRVYEQFKPMSEWRQEDDRNTLLVYLPGFQKEYIKVTTQDVNTVRIRGERLVVGNKWSRFQEDFRVPENCDMRGIRARFDGGILTVSAPRVAPKAEEQPFRRTKQEEALPKDKEKPTSSKAAVETEKKTLPPQPTPETLKKEESKEKPTSSKTGVETEKKPNRPPSPLKGSTLPPRPTPASLSKPSKQEELKKEESTEKPTSSKTGVETEKKPDKGSTLPPQPTPASLSKPSKQEVLKKEESKEKPTSFKTGVETEKKPDKGSTLPPQPTPASLSKPSKQEVLKKEESKEKPTSFKTGVETEKKPDKPPSPLKGSTLPPQPTPASSSKQEELKTAAEAKEAKEELKFGSLPAGVSFMGDKVEEKKKVVGRRGVNEDRKLLVNVGVGVLVIVALGVHVFYNFGRNK